MDKEFIMATAKTTEQQILWSINKWEYMSWGVRQKAAIEYEGMATLALRVSGVVHKGWVFISLNEGMDCYEVRLLNVARTKVKRMLEEVYCDNLGEVLDGLIERKAEWTDEQYKRKAARDSARKMGMEVLDTSKNNSKTEETMANEVKFRPATMAEIEGRDTDLYMDGEQVWVMMIHRSETIGEGEAKLDYIMLTNMKKVQVEDLQVIDDAPEESPMMKQYKDLKAKYPDSMILFRCGDFYESYGEDAKEAAKILGITLTWRTPQKRHAPGDYTDAMVGFPHHALDTYLPKLTRAGKKVAICDQLPDPPKTKRGITETINNETTINQNNTTMATVEMNNESVNVQNAAQVNNNAAAIEDVNVGEVTLDSICPVMQPVEEKPAVTVPLGDHGTLVIAGVGNDKPKTTKSGKPSDRFDLEKDKPKVTLKRKTQVQDSVPQAATLPRVTLVTYITSRSQEQAPRIEGFGGENDPRWKRHADERERLKALKADADKKNEKLRKQMKGKTRAEKDELMKKWVRVPNDPFNAVIDKDRTTGDKRYIFLMGAKYMDVARELVDAYNSGDEQAIAAAEQAVIDCKNGIVKDIEAQRDAKRAEREAKKSEERRVKSEESATAQPAMDEKEQAMFDLFKKFMAGDATAMQQVGAMMAKQAA